MLLLFSKFIGFFPWINTCVDYLQSVMSAPWEKYCFFVTLCVWYGLSLCGVGSDDPVEMCHHCFKEAFSSFMVVFTTGFRLSLTNKVCCLFYVFTLTEINYQPQHSWTTANVLAYFAVSFSSFSLTYKMKTAPSFEFWSLWQPHNSQLCKHKPCKA